MGIGLYELDNSIVRTRIALYISIEQSNDCQRIPTGNYALVVQCGANFFTIGFDGKVEGDIKSVESAISQSCNLQNQWEHIAALGIAKALLNAQP